MKSVAFFFLGILFCLSEGVFAQNGNSFEAWEKKARQLPEVLLIELQEQQSALTQNQQLYLIAQAYQQTAKFFKVDSILNYLFESQSIAEDSILYIKCVKLRFDQKRLTSNLKDALIELNKVIDFYEMNQDTFNLADNYISLSELYRSSGDHEFAVKSLAKAEELIDKHSKNKLKYLLARLYITKATLSGPSTLGSKKEFYSLKSLEYSREIKDNHLIASAYNEIGVYYYEVIPPDPRSERYLKEATLIWDTIGYDVYWLNGLINLTRYYGRVNRNQEALDILLAQKPKIDSTSFEWGKGQYYGVLGKIYAKLGQYKKAYLFKRIGTNIQYKEGVNKYKEQLSIYTFKLEAKEQEEQILKKEQQLELTDLKLKSEKKAKWFLYVILFAAAVILFIALYSRSRISKQRNELAIQKTEIEEKNVVISSNNEKLSELVQQREALLKEVNHRVKNNLTVLSSLLFLQGENLKSEEAKVALYDSQLRINSISLIHESLYSRDDMDHVNVQEYIQDLFNQIKGIYWTQNKEVKLELNLKDYQTELKESVPIGMVLNELITNSFKYAFSEVEQPEISIQYTDHKIIYFDNGSAYEIVESSSSIGLQLVTVFALQLKAKISYDNSKGYTQTIIQLAS